MKVDPLGDGISSLELRSSMGDDLMVVDAARVSLAKESEWEYRLLEDSLEVEEVLSYDDTRLINYLAKHKHWTPFSHPQIQFRIKMPIAIARQWFKHQIGITRNEVSRRYVSDEPEVFIPASLRSKPEKSIKQGSGEEHEHSFWLIESMALEVERQIDNYNRLIEIGICPEQARFFLPQGTYTEFIETGSLAAYARIANLRLDPHAQYEVRVYAQAVADHLSKLFPISWEALSKY